MNQEVKAKWLEALRSGEYEQGVKALKTEDGKYCCLGVLTDLYAKDKEDSWVKDERGKYVLSSDRRREDLYLPDDVIEWAELDEGDPIARSSGATLAQLNDYEQRTFLEIAEVIDANL